MTQEKPLISVIIPTYNRANTILRAVGSVLNQTYRNLEVIIIDDASTDNTEEIIKNLNDSRIIYIKHEFNKGGAAARNTGISLAKGGYIAFLDSDDEWLADKLEKQVQLIKQRPADYGLFYTGSYRMANERKIKRRVVPKYRGEIHKELLALNCVDSFSSVIAKKDLLLGIGGLDETLPSCQDWDLYIRLSNICKFDFVADCLVKYLESSSIERISTRANDVIDGHFKIYEKYKGEIDRLPLCWKGKFFDNIGKRFIVAGAYAMGIRQVIKGLIISKNLYRFSKSMIFIVATYITNG